MGREVRRVPAGWQHPVDNKGKFKPLLTESFREAVNAWVEGKIQWEHGLRYHYGEEKYVPHNYDGTWEEWSGEFPKEPSYMPDWPEEEKTHLMMYETCSEGTPISPALKTPEELAQWLVDNGASAFGGMTATYDHWLRVCRGGWAPSAIITRDKIMSGVEGVGEIKKDTNA